MQVLLHNGVYIYNTPSQGSPVQRHQSHAYALPSVTKLNQLELVLRSQKLEYSLMSFPLSLPTADSLLTITHSERKSLCCAF